MVTIPWKSYLMSTDSLIFGPVVGQEMVNLQGAQYILGSYIATFEYLSHSGI